MAIHALHEEQLEVEQLREEAEGLEKCTTSMLDFRERWRIPIVINKVINKRRLSTSDAHIWNIVSRHFEAKTASAAFKMMTTAMATPMPSVGEDGSSGWGSLGKSHGTKGGRGHHKPGLAKQNSAPHRSLIPAAMFSGEGNAAIVKNASGKSSTASHPADRNSAAQAKHGRGSTGSTGSAAAQAHHSNTATSSATSEGSMFSAISTSVKKRLGLTKASTSPNLNEAEHHGRGSSAHAATAGHPNGQEAHHLERRHTSDTGAAAVQQAHDARGLAAGQSHLASAHKDQHAVAGTAHPDSGERGSTAGPTLGLKGYISPRPSQRHGERPPTIEESDAAETSVHRPAHGGNGDHAAGSHTASADHSVVGQHRAATANHHGAHPGAASHSGSGSQTHAHVPQQHAVHPAAGHDLHSGHPAVPQTGHHSATHTASESHGAPHNAADHGNQGHNGHNADRAAHNNQHGHDNHATPPHSASSSPDSKAHALGQNHGQPHGKSSPNKESNQKPASASPTKRRSLLMRLSISLGIVDGNDLDKDENAPAAAALLRDLMSSHAQLEEPTSPLNSRVNSKDRMVNPYDHSRTEEESGSSKKPTAKPTREESKGNFFARGLRAFSSRTFSTAPSSTAGSMIIVRDSQEALSPTSHSPVPLTKVRSTTSPDTTPRAREHVDGHSAFHGRTDAKPSKPVMFPEEVVTKTPPRHAHPHESVTAQSKGNAMGKIWEAVMGNNKVAPGK
jgi:hypothetical protein